MAPEAAPHDISTVLPLALAAKVPGVPGTAPPPASASRAALTLMKRCAVAPAARVSFTSVPVFCSACSTCVTDAPGAACFSTAQAPATCGVAIDVPLSDW